MGLYDEVKVEQHIPGVPEWAQSTNWKTKDLACQMESFTITLDGFLVDSDKKVVQYHGDIGLYDEQHGEWIVCVARMTNDRVQSIMSAELHNTMLLKQDNRTIHLKAI